VLGVYDRLPRVFVHRDAFRNNLLARGDRTVAVDWALAGPGHLGEDLYKMVNITLMFQRSPCRARELDAAAFEGYLAGLRGAGWTGDARLARLGYAATSLLHTPSPPLMGLLRNPDWLRGWAEHVGRPADEVGAVLTDMLLFNLDLADEARGLLPLLG
jgi:aminoglycoside phosphotransferase (APT) family kinase protein